jgi:Ser-tRNA(Ala) deacylase AlaX
VEKLWLTDPRRRTALAKVTRVKGGAFALDRCLFAPTSHLHRHPQPKDVGTVWFEGEKRILVDVRERDGFVWHRLRGFTPPVGAQLNCHLDADRRLAASRAHTAMHLLVRALGATMVRDPEVKGGGHFRLELDAPIPAKDLAQALAQANAWVAEGHRVTREHLPRSAAHLIDAQRFQPPDPHPGPEVLTVARIDGVCAYPCDGTHVDNTRDVGRIVIVEAHGRVVVGRAGNS